MRRVVIGISGASGAIYGLRLLEVLRAVDDVETHLVLTSPARRTITLETERSVRQVEALADRVHRTGDIAAPISSGSFQTAGMIVAPCSMKTAAGIATSYSENLLLRAADVMLKERRPLVLLVRETPLHLGHLRTLAALSELGVTIMPPVPAFYARPQTVAELVDHTVGRALDQLGIEPAVELFARWTGPCEHSAVAERSGEEDPPRPVRARLPRPMPRRGTSSDEPRTSPATGIVSREPSPGRG